MKNKLRQVFDGCMIGRTLYLIPFSMGPIAGPYSIVGLELTDSAYVAVNMKIMTRMGQEVTDYINNTNWLVIPCVHSVGYPLING